MKKLKWEKTDTNEWKSYVQGNHYRIRQYFNEFTLRSDPHSSVNDLTFKKLSSAKKVAQLIYNG